MKKFTLGLLLILSSLIGFSQSIHQIGELQATDVALRGDSLYIIGGSAKLVAPAYEVRAPGQCENVILDSMGFDPSSVGFFTEDIGIAGYIGSYKWAYYMTTDGGRTWDSIPESLHAPCLSRQPFDIHIVTDSIAVVSLNRNGGYSITFDQGNSWSCDQTFGTASPARFTITPSHDFYTYEQDVALYKSTNYGETWTKVVDDRIGGYLMVDDTLGFAQVYPTFFGYDSTIIYRTTDGWDTYERITHPGLTLDLLAFGNAEEPNTLYYFDHVTWGSDLYRIADITDPTSTEEFLGNINGSPSKTKKILGAWYAAGLGLYRFVEENEDYKPCLIIPADSCVSCQEPVDSCLNCQDLADGTIYPNPADEKVTIKGNDITEIRIQDFTGRVRLAHTWDEPDPGIDVRSLPNGTYILRYLQADTGKWASKKLMIKRE